MLQWMRKVPRERLPPGEMHNRNDRTLRQRAHAANKTETATARDVAPTAAGCVTSESFDATNVVPQVTRREDQLRSPGHECSGVCVAPKTSHGQRDERSSWSYIGIGDTVVLFPPGSELVLRWQELEDDEAECLNMPVVTDEEREIRRAKRKFFELLHYAKEHAWFEMRAVEAILTDSYKCQSTIANIRTRAQWRQHICEVWQFHPELGQELLAVLRSTHECDFARTFTQ